MYMENYTIVLNKSDADMLGIIPDYISEVDLLQKLDAVRQNSKSFDPFLLLTSNNIWRIGKHNALLTQYLTTIKEMRNNQVTFTRTNLVHDIQMANEAGSRNRELSQKLSMLRSKLSFIATLHDGELKHLSSFFNRKMTDSDLQKDTIVLEMFAEPPTVLRVKAQ